MFEKESESIYYKKFPVTLSLGEGYRHDKICEVIQESIEYGYNKAKEEYETRIKTLTLNHDELLAENERLVALCLRKKIKSIGIIRKE